MRKGFRSFVFAAIPLNFIISYAHAKDFQRATIIDLAASTKEDAKLLADLGVTVIGRYYGRCPQWETLGATSE